MRGGKWMEVEELGNEKCCVRESKRVRGRESERGGGRER